MIDADETPKSRDSVCARFSSTVFSIGKSRMNMHVFGLQIIVWTLRRT